MVQTVLVGCIQISIYIKDLSVSTVPGEFDEGVLAGWECILLIYFAHLLMSIMLIYDTLVSQPDSYCQREINLNINAEKTNGPFPSGHLTLAFLETEVPMLSLCWQQ